MGGQVVHRPHGRPWREGKGAIELSQGKSKLTFQVIGKAWYSRELEDVITRTVRGASLRWGCVGFPLLSILSALTMIQQCFVFGTIIGE